ITEKAFCDAVRGALRQLATLAAAEAVSTLHEVEVAGRDLVWRPGTQVSLARESAYRFDRLKSKKEADPVKPGRLTLLVERGQQDGAERAVTHAVALANGTDLAKDLGNLPGNVCTPAYLAETAKTLAADFKLKVQVLERRQMQALKMG